MPPMSLWASKAPSSDKDTLPPPPPKHTYTPISDKQLNSATLHTTFHRRHTYLCSHVLLYHLVISYFSFVLTFPLTSSGSLTPPVQHHTTTPSVEAAAQSVVFGHAVWNTTVFCICQYPQYFLYSYQDTMSNWSSEGLGRQRPVLLVIYYSGCSLSSLSSSSLSMRLPMRWYLELLNQVTGHSCFVALWGRRLVECQDTLFLRWRRGDEEIRGGTHSAVLRTVCIDREITK